MPEQILRLAIDPRRAVQGSRTFRREVDRTKASAIGLDKAVVGVTASIAAFAAARGARAAIRAAIDWEQALAGVAKTVDASAAQIQRLGAEIREMSEAIPVAANDLARIAEAAGQLGIETANIVGFTRVMADLGVATNLTADEAATALARLANVMGTPQDAFDRLGSTIVDLGNNLATTERELVEFASRMAGAGRIAGLTEADVLAIGGAMSSVGIEAEAGGTAVQKVLIDMNTAVQRGGTELARFADAAGMSATQFATLWQDDAASAFTAFVEGLGRAGDGAVTILSDLGLENARLVRSFLSLANAGPLLGDAVGRANEAWRENNALTVEAERFYATLGSQLQTLRNEITNAAAQFGERLGPAILFVIDRTSDLIDDLGELSDELDAATFALKGLVDLLRASQPLFTEGIFALDGFDWGEVFSGPPGLSTLVETFNKVSIAIQEMQALQAEGREVPGIGPFADVERLVEMARERAEATAESAEQSEMEAQIRAGLARVDAKIAEDRRRAADETARAAAEAMRGSGVIKNLERAGTEIARLQDEIEALEIGAAFATGKDELDEFLKGLDESRGKLERLQLAAKAYVDEFLRANQFQEFGITAGGGFQSQRIPNARVLSGNLLPFGRELEFIGQEANRVAVILGDATGWMGSLGDEVGGLQVADQVARSVASLVGTLGDVDPAARAAVRGVSDIIGGIRAIQAGGVLGGITGAAGILGGVVGAISGLIGDDDAEALREARRAQADYTRALEDFVRATEGGIGNLQSQTENAITEAAELAIQSLRGTGINVDVLGPLPRTLDELEEFFANLQTTLDFFGLFGSTAGQAAELARIMEVLGDRLEMLQEQRRAEIESLQQDAQIRILRAQGQDDLADKLARQVERETELARAAELGDQKLIDLLRELYGLEDAALRAAAAAEQAARDFRRAQFGGDLTARELALEGDDRGALAARLAIQAAAERQRAQELLEAGDITQQMFDRLAAVLQGELNQALEDFDQAAQDAADAAREAAEAEKFRAMVDLENLRIRLLVAQGQDEEAQSLRNQLEIMQALQEGRDEEFIALLRQVQAAEAAARARQQEARALDETRRAIDGVTRALNAPAGLNLALRRYQVGRQALGGGVPSLGPAPANQQATVNAPITIVQRPGEDSQELATRVVQELDRRARAGNAFVLTEA